MEKEMEGLYIGGVANRGGAESCVGVREGVGEALTGVRAGWAIEPRKDIDRDADALITSGRHYRPAAFVRESLAGSRGVGEPGHVRDLSMCENREIPWLAVGCQ